MASNRNDPERDRDGRDEGDEDRSQRLRRTAIILLSAAIPVILGLYGLTLYMSRPVEHGERIRLDQFFTLVRDGRVQDAVILDTDNRVIGQSDQGPFWVTYGERETAFQTVFNSLRNSEVPTNVEQQWFKGVLTPFAGLILPALLIATVLILAFLLVWRRGSDDSLFGFGHASARRATDESKITFRDVAGLEEACEELGEVRDYLSNPDRFVKMGARVPKGILLTGPPGCGKTLLARAVAGEAGVPFFSISGSDFVEMYVGVGAARIRDLFKTATSNAPCIVFIDELDAVGRGRTAAAVGGQDERETTLNQLLVSLDGFDATTGVVVLAATNRVDVLDSALLRPGRFDRRIGIDRPDRKGRSGILEIHARGKPLADDVDLEVIARRTPGFSGADLANVINEAALLAARYGHQDIRQAELREAVERVIAGPERRSRVMNPRDRRLNAHHEAGHAVVAASLPGAELPHKVSIVTRGHAAGMTWLTPTEEWVFATKSQLLDRLAAILAGRAAEELYAGEAVSGASSDLQKASELAWRMVADLGMGEEMGPVSVQGLPTDGRVALRVSEHVASTVDREVRQLLVAAKDRARQVLERHRGVWESLADRLLEEETIEGPDLELLLDEVRDRSEPPPEPERVSAADRGGGGKPSSPEGPPGAEAGSTGGGGDERRRSDAVAGPDPSDTG